MAESTAANPTLLQAQVANLLVQPLEAASVVLAAGPRIFDTASELRIPKLISSGTPAFVAEGAEIADTHDVEFDEVKLMPTNRRSIKTILRYTNELVRQSVVGIDAVLKARLVKDVSDLLDSALLTGAGATNSIRGITAQTGITPGELDVTDADCLLDAIAALNAKEVTPNRWFISGADFAALRKLKVDDLGAVPALSRTRRSSRGRPSSASRRPSRTSCPRGPRSWPTCRPSPSPATPRRA